VDRTFNEVVARERAALDRWVTGDPDGYLDISASEVTYFDPYQEKRTDGLNCAGRATRSNSEHEAAIHGTALRNDRSDGSAVRRRGVADL
jgi:hypothetical protein